MATTNVPGEYAHVNGIHMHYVRKGSGTPLLLIHGWPGFWYEWHLNIDPLSQHFDVVVPDMRGFAYSEKPDAAPADAYTAAHFADDIRALIDHLGFERVNIVAHDFGASWVQRFARTYPERLEKLMLFDPPYEGIGARWFEMPQPLHSWYMLFHQQAPFTEELVGSSRKATEIYLRHFLSAWSANKDLWTDDEIAEYVEAYSQPGALRGGFSCYRAAFMPLPPPPHGNVIATPTTVLWGDSDSILPFAWSDRLPEFFSNLTLKKIEGAGHFMMREAPDRVNQEIIDFMA